MPRQVEVYLDIETDFYRQPTVIGFHSSVTGVVQLVGTEITRRRLHSELPKSGVLYTYNGHSFDLSCIRKSLGVNLRERFHSRDLLYSCRSAGLRGTQKLVEEWIGFSRKLPGVNGMMAIHWWNQYSAGGDSSALAKLLTYNREDLKGLAAIKRHLAKHARECLDC